MLKKKDMLVIGAVLLIALIMLAVSRLLPKTNIEERIAEVTMAPDAVEYLEATEAPAATAAPDATASPEATAAPDATEAPAATASPAATEAPAAEMTAAPTEESAADTGSGAPVMAGPMLPAQTQPVGGHVILTVSGRQYGDPIPMDRDKIITIRQSNGQINKVHITPDSAYMEYSTCDNQDCVGQGHITLDNYETRILSTFVICLPNNVTIEMVPAEE